MADKDELDQLWCGQTIGPPTKGEDMLTMAMERAERFDRTIKARNLRECLGAVLLTAIFAFIAWNSPNALARAGNVVVAASGLWIFFCMLRYGREAPSPAPDRRCARGNPPAPQTRSPGLRRRRGLADWTGSEPGRRRR